MQVTGELVVRQAQGPSGPAREFVHAFALNAGQSLVLQAAVLYFSRRPDVSCCSSIFSHTLA